MISIICFIVVLPLIFCKPAHDITFYSVLTENCAPLKDIKGFDHQDVFNKCKNGNIQNITVLTVNNQIDFLCLLYYQSIVAHCNFTTAELLPKNRSQFEYPKGIVCSEKYGIINLTPLMTKEVCNALCDDTQTQNANYLCSLLYFVNSKRNTLMTGTYLTTVPLQNNTNKHDDTQTQTKIEPSKILAADSVTEKKGVQSQSSNNVIDSSKSEILNVVHPAGELLQKSIKPSGDVATGNISENEDQYNKKPADAGPSNVSKNGKQSNTLASGSKPSNMSTNMNQHNMNAGDSEPHNQINLKHIKEDEIKANNAAVDSEPHNEMKLKHMKEDEIKANNAERTGDVKPSTTNELKPQTQDKEPSTSDVSAKNKKANTPVVDENAKLDINIDGGDKPMTDDYAMAEQTDSNYDDAEKDGEMEPKAEKSQTLSKQKSDSKPSFSKQKSESKPLVTIEDEPVNSQSDLEGESYFFSYFMVICVFFALGYIGYHNKQKIFALALEGKRGKRQYRSRRPNSANYHKLDNNLEEAISSSCSKNSSNIIY